MTIRYYLYEFFAAFASVFMFFVFAMALTCLTISFLVWDAKLITLSFEHYTFLMRANAVVSFISAIIYVFSIDKKETKE